MNISKGRIDSQQPQSKSNRHGNPLHPLQRQHPDLRKRQAQRQDVGQDVDGPVDDAHGLGTDAVALERRVKQLGDRVAEERVDEAEDEGGQEHEGEDERGGGAEVGHDFEDAVVHEQDGRLGRHHGPLVEELPGQVQLVARREEAWRDLREVAAEAQGEEDAGDDDVGDVS